MNSKASNIRIPISPKDMSSSATSSSIALLCPSCSNRDIRISEVRKSSTTNSLQMKITCDKCQIQKKEKKIDLEKYLSFISSSSSKSEKCFKHKDLVGTIFCKNCGFYMCNICYSYHQVFEPTHETKYGIDESNFCKFHKEQNLDFYCENCDVNLCAECGRKFHCGHSVIQLREYWEKVNNKLGFHNNKELNKYVQNEIMRYDLYTKQQIAAIDKIIVSFQQLRNIIEQNHKIALKNNQIALNLVDSMYTEFYQCKYYPKFNLIQNVENINVNVLITKNDLLSYTRILDGIHKHFQSLAEFHAEMSNKLIISERRKKNLIIQKNEIVINPSMNNTIHFLNRKKQCKEEELFQVPKESSTTNVINNSQQVNNNTTNNIILPIKVAAPVVNKKPKDIFTFDAVICSKYIPNNNTETTNTHQGDSTNNYFESFSNTSSVYETFDCIHLGKVEDNQIIKKYRKKKEEKNKNNSTQEITKESKTNDNKNTTVNNNQTVNESVQEDLDIFNNVFGEKLESPDIFNNTINIDESLLGPKSPL